MQAEETINCSGMEEKLLRELECHLSPEKARKLLSGRHVCCRQARRGTAILLCRLHGRLGEALRASYTSGIQVALVIGNKTVLSLGLLALMMREGIRPDKGYVVVNEKAAELFTYGRDVFASSVIHVSRPKGCNRVIVMDPEGDMLGFGLVKQGRGSALILNLVDVGWYLRSGL